MAIFYVGDTHFGHSAVIRFNNRPFSTVEEMDNTLLSNWQSIVGADDEVYIVGDLIFRAKKPPEYYLERLTGRKHLILGNHDRWAKRVDLDKCFESVSQIKEIHDADRHIVLCHFPMVEWPRSHYNSILVFGHIHNRTTGEGFNYYLSRKNMLNAGVDINCYCPVNYYQLVANNEYFRKINKPDFRHDGERDFE